MNIIELNETLEDFLCKKNLMESETFTIKDIVKEVSNCVRDEWEENNISLDSFLKEKLDYYFDDKEQIIEMFKEIVNEYNSIYLDLSYAVYDELKNKIKEQL